VGIRINFFIFMVILYLIFFALTIVPEGISKPRVQSQKIIVNSKLILADENIFERP
jgi:uncharacterized membrane protein